MPYTFTREDVLEVLKGYEEVTRPLVEKGEWASLALQAGNVEKMLDDYREETGLRLGLGRGDWCDLGSHLGMVFDLGAKPNPDAKKIRATHNLCLGDIPEVRKIIESREPAPS